MGFRPHQANSGQNRVLQFGHMTSASVEFVLHKSIFKLSLFMNGDENIEVDAR